VEPPKIDGNAISNKYLSMVFFKDIIFFLKNCNFKIFNCERD